MGEPAHPLPVALSIPHSPHARERRGAGATQEHGFRELAAVDLGGGEGSSAPRGSPAWLRGERGMLLRRGGRWTSTGVHRRFGMRFRKAGERKKKRKQKPSIHYFYFIITISMVTHSQVCRMPQKLTRNHS